MGNKNYYLTYIRSIVHQSQGQSEPKPSENPRVDTFSWNTVIIIALIKLNSSIIVTVTPCPGWPEMVLERNKTRASCSS